ncbi:MAG: DEAD/DEAH box helicase [Candidatus Campbellbacteria bacterium]|nr:DEAD/DEAH box helicase [Candidatus Campbellbacteria bacterium]
MDVNKFINKPEVVEEKQEEIPEHSSFNDFEVDERIKKNIIDKGFETPTPIQDKIIPHLLDGLDVVGIANTGTGKTAAFLIPLIDKVLKDPSENILIITPTRELAIQIHDELIELTKKTSVFGVCCVGGAPIERQIRAIERPYTKFVIGTPGRIEDLMDQDILDVSKYNSVVLDEADRMLDMGFIEDMRFILNHMPTERHTMFFSATFSKEIESLVDEFLNKPVRVSVKTGETAKNVEQDVIKIDQKVGKVNVLCELLNEPGFEKVLVFGRTKRGVENLSNALLKKGIKAGSIHGDKSQFQRQRALGLFKENQLQVLIATDVAARGLDISNISHVINFDLPATDEDYIHRIGRTGRADKKGKALTFVE